MSDDNESGIFVSEGEKFEVAPAGFFRAVCIDVDDLGMVATNFGQKRKVLFIWQIDARAADGTPLLRKDGTAFHVAKRYTASLDSRASLRKDLRSWRGQDFTPEEAKRFNLERVIGQPCMLQVIHQTQDGETYANVEIVTQPTPPFLAAPTDYIRRKNRPKEEKGQKGAKPQAAAQAYTQPAQAAPPAGMVTPNQLAGMAPAGAAPAGARF